MSTPGEGRETVQCPRCNERVGGDEPVCPICDCPLWDGEED